MDVRESIIRVDTKPKRYIEVTLDGSFGYTVKNLKMRTNIYKLFPLHGTLTYIGSIREM